ncbi:laccase, multicopper oxidase, benzenediol:oxygen oxidorectuctase [Saitozyma podzolica]|uniref:Laccase, multicopper oxidase, benzenediol:oxygen oxidorectuctase n=1 Tax=Saitozyma podzolica TaxID=1890683 RepID=A0A427Y3J8_9TREE|nr:laccase, multicopper oxidase, benzenediol:oxygen oxidorectuctase [Saitozyma podzolica]
MRASALAFALITLINIPDLAAAVYMPATLKYDRMIAQGPTTRQPGRMAKSLLLKTRISSATATSSGSAVTATYDSSIFTLNSSFVITDVPSRHGRYASVRSTQLTPAPDGYERTLYAVNGQFPGPLIEANEGDTVIVHVTNNLAMGQSIHWHGMLMNGTQYMDGVPGFSQCPIPAGGSFTYNFTITNQYGSYWWHSHYGNTVADGLVGGLIVHSVNDPLKLGQDYDEERVLMLADWVDVLSDTVVAELAGGGFDGSRVPPQGDAILVNGISVARINSSCEVPIPPEIQVPVNKRIRFRVLNHGSHLLLRLSIDQHPFQVVEVDDTPVYGPDLHELPIAVGQRYSIVVNTTEGTVGDVFWLRANAAVASFRYVEDGVTPTTQQPTTQAWTDLAAANSECDDLDETNSLTPRVAMYPPESALDTHVLSSAFGTFVNVTGQSNTGFGFNNVSYQNQINDPLLAQVERGQSINSSLIANVAFDGIGGGDIIVNNLDAGIVHPYHLHGRSFFLIQGGSWAVLRIITDTPGVWPLHCHIGWHLAQGKMAAIVVQPDAVERIAQPWDWSNLCAGKDAGAWGPD